jgi:hypothetical protein
LGSETILAELRAEFRTGGQSHHPNAPSFNRAGNPSRHFFKPIEALFVDRSPERANSGQISRGSLTPIWDWINLSLLPETDREYSDKMKPLIAGNDLKQAGLVAGAFQMKVVEHLEEALASEEGVERVRTGLGKYTSSRAAFEDLKKVLSALRVRDAIVAFNEALPPKIDNLDGGSLARVRQLLDAFAAKHPEAMPFALTMVGKRLKTLWQLIRLATEMAHSKNAGDIATSRYAISISMVLDHLDDKRIALSQTLKSNRVLIAKDILAEIHDIEHALRIHINELAKSEWGRRLEELMAAIVAELQTEVQTLPETIRDVLARMLHRHGAAGARLAGATR